MDKKTAVFVKTNLSCFQIIDWITSTTEHKIFRKEKITSFSEDVEATIVKDVAVHRPQATLPHPTNIQICKSGQTIKSNKQIIKFGKISF